MIATQQHSDELSNASFAASLPAAPNSPLAEAEMTNSPARTTGSGKVTINGKESDFTYEARQIAESVQQFFVKASDQVTEFFGGLSLALKSLISRPASGTTAAITAAAALAASTHETSAARLPDGSDPAVYSAYGQSLNPTVFGQTVWLTISGSDGITYTASGILWDSTHVLTAAHNLSDVGFTGNITQVGTGPNSISNPGQSVGVLSSLLNPTWDFSHSGNSLDAAMLTLAAPLSGNYAQTGTPSLGGIYSGLGYGIVHTPSGGDLPFDGDLRGWTTRESRLGSAGGDFSANYIQLTLSGVNTGPYTGGGWYGDSGGGVYDSGGYLDGMNVSWSGSPSSPGGSTYALSMNAISPWAVSVVPEPSTFALVSLGVGTLLLLRKRKS